VCDAQTAQVIGELAATPAFELLKAFPHPARGRVDLHAPAPKATTPTLPARLIARRASTIATPSATSAFRRLAVPKAIDGERSSTIQVVIARSGTCRRTWG
jgi:hypothetical protein